ncbi:MAG: Sua5/YciO/YrdC/YwlC family protein [bacterium]|nr:Sua5/YciO/YrdC/YwlC family protein [bacterium]
MATSLGWADTEDKRDIVHIVVQALVEGKLVVLPTETAYHVVASGLNEAALEQLQKLREQGKVASPALLLRSSGESMDYCPGMSRVARRAVGRGWPGPLVLELPIHAAGDEEGTQAVVSEEPAADSSLTLANRLPGVAKSLVLKEGFLAQRVVPHAVVTEAMRLTPGPLIAAACVDEQAGPLSRPEEVARSLGSNVSILVDDGQTHFGGFATRIRVVGNECALITPGVIEADKRERLFHLVILLVCTGNTCRSPMAEVMLKSLLAESFPQHCGPGANKVHVASAGLSAFPGGPASAEAQSVMERRQLSLRNHQSRALTEQALRYADLVLTMTRSHRAAIVDQLPSIASKVHVLSGSLDDVSDPFGGTETIYDACANQIEGYLRNWVHRMDDSWFPVWRSE